MNSVYEAPEAVQYSWVSMSLSDPLSGMIDGGSGEGGNTNWDTP